MLQDLDNIVVIDTETGGTDPGEHSLLSIHDEVRALCTKLADATAAAQAHAPYLLQDLLPVLGDMAETLPRLCDAAVADRQRADLLEGFLTELVKDLDVDVREVLAGRPDIPWALGGLLAEDQDENVRETIAVRADLPMDLVVKLATDKAAVVREVIAEREDLPAGLVAKLAEDEIEWVRCRIAERADLPAGLVAKLAEDKGPHVRQAIAQRAKG